MDQQPSKPLFTDMDILAFQMDEADTITEFRLGKTEEEAKKNGVLALVLERLLGEPVFKIVFSDGTEVFANTRDEVVDMVVDFANKGAANEVR